MHRVAISSTGIFTPPEIITNEELVAAYNAYAALENEKYADEIAAGTRTALTDSNVEFIEKASGIKRRYVMNKSGVLDPRRMRPEFKARPDTELSMMAEIAVKAGQDALNNAGKTAADVDGVYCAAANMQRAYPAMGVEIQTALGINGYAFDMNVACSSATFALEMAYNAVRTGSARAILVVNPEITTATWPGWTAIATSSLVMCARPSSWNGRIWRPKARSRFWVHACKPRFPTPSATTQVLCPAPKTATPKTATNYSGKRAAECSRKSAPWPLTTWPATWSHTT